MSFIYFNGKFIDHGEAALDPLDRGVQLGDGIFETIRCEEGQLLYHVAHFSRLARSARIIRLPWSMPNEELLDICQQVLDANGLNAVARLRITITRGESTGSPEIGTSRVAPTVIIHATALDQVTFDQKRSAGVTLALARFPRNHHSPLATIKTTSYLEQLLARQDARDANADEALLLNTDGRLAECAMSNIFAVKEGVILTPPVAEGALPGTMRLKIGILAPRLEIEYQERPMTLKELREADEVFITNATGEIIPVIAIGDGPLGAGAGLGPVAQRLFDAHRADINLYLATMRHG